MKIHTNLPHVYPHSHQQTTDVEKKVFEAETNSAPSRRSCIVDGYEGTARASAWRMPAASCSAKSGRSTVAVIMCMMFMGIGPRATRFEVRLLLSDITRAKGVTAGFCD